MNYLAHLYLADESGHSLQGALLGDVLKGNAWQLVPAAVQAAVLQHRALDRFTDEHPFVSRRRALFGQGERRFAGLVIDVAIDHWLSCHFQPLTGCDLSLRVATLHRRLDQEWRSYALARLPQLATHGSRVRRMIDERWLLGYADPGNVALALAGIERRLTRSPALAKLWQRLPFPPMDELQRFHDDSLAFARAWPGG